MQTQQQRRVQPNKHGLIKRENGGSFSDDRQQSGDYFELIAVMRVHVLEKNHAGDLELRLELADGNTLERISTRAEYADFLEHPPSVII
jgi:hypothetical protein